MAKHRTNVLGQNPVGQRYIIAVIQYLLWDLRDYESTFPPALDTLNSFYCCQRGALLNTVNKLKQESSHPKGCAEGSSDELFPKIPIRLS